MKILLVAGARPNFMKIASVIEAIHKYNDLIENSKLKIQHCLVHTGQHYDDSMSDAFFRDLELPKPDIHLDVGSASHAVQTSEIMRRFEPVLLEHRPDVVMVVGDVNSTIACTLVASKIDYHTPKLRRKPLIAHVEAGLRSFDRSMPEETNRILTDQLSDFLFVSEQSGLDNLKNEGFKNFLFEGDILQISDASHLAPHDLPVVSFVGNTMIDTLLKHRKLAQNSNILERLNLKQPGLKTEDPEVSRYAILTLHRPSNVDDRKTFLGILEALSVVSKGLPIIFPVHPRTLNRVKEFGFEKYFNFPYHNTRAQNLTINVKNSYHYHLTLKAQHLDLTSQSSVLSPHQGSLCCIEPLGYLDFLCLMSNAKLVLTDSGGIQEEATVLDIPCVTLRENTERPITITHGTNMLAGIEKEQIVKSAFLQLGEYNRETSSTPQSLSLRRRASAPPLWDGHAGERIIKILASRIA